MPAAAAAWFAHRIRYPWLARRMGWEGRVRLALLVRAHRVQEARLLQSSGHALLDRAAREGVLGAAGAPVKDGQWLLSVRFALR